MYTINVTRHKNAFFPTKISTLFKKRSKGPVLLKTLNKKHIAI